MAVLSLKPYYRSPYPVTVGAPSFSRILSNVAVVAEDRARVDAQLIYAIAHVEAEGIDASGAWVAESDSKRRRDLAMGHLLQEIDSASWEGVFHFD